MLNILRVTKYLTSAGLFRAIILTAPIYMIYLVGILALPELRVIWSNSVRVVDFKYLGPNMPVAVLLSASALFCICYVVSLIFQRTAMSRHPKKPLNEIMGHYTISTLSWGVVISALIFYVFVIYLSSAVFIALVLSAKDIGGPLTDESLLGKPQEVFDHRYYRSLLISSAIIFPFVVSVIWCALRFSLIIPAAAIGLPITLADSWEKTKPYALYTMKTVSFAVLLLFLGWALVEYGYKDVTFGEATGYVAGVTVLFYALLVFINAIAAGLFSRTCTH